METLNEEDIRAIFLKIKDIMVEKKDLLIGLDGAIGDGDLGLAMSIGFTKVAEALQDFKEKDVGKIFMQAGVILAKNAPSTIGTLIATGFMKGGKVVQGREEIGLTEIFKMMDAFVKEIMIRGKAKPGEKTVLDSLCPAVQAFKLAQEKNKTLKEGLVMAYNAALQGVESTKNMVSQHGRAAYYQKNSVGKQDPGATAGMLIIKAFADYISEKN